MRGVGDDCAIIADGARDLLITTDALVENVHFNPNAWTRCGEPNAPQGEDVAKLLAYLQANLVAFEVGRSDWEMMVDTFTYGAKVGYRFYDSERGITGATNGSFLGIAADWAARSSSSSADVSTSADTTLPVSSTVRARTTSPPMPRLVATSGYSGTAPWSTLGGTSCAAAPSQVLQEERHAAERSVGQRATRLAARALERLVDDGVELGVEALDPRDGSIDQLDRLHVAASHRSGLICRVHIRPGIRHASLLLLPRRPSRARRARD